MNHKLRKALLLSAMACEVVALAAWAGPAFAASDGSASAAPAQETGIETVVVTAQKRAENSQKVPIAISALGSEQLATMQINDSSSLAQFVPGLNISRANVTAVPFLRGVGNTSANPGNEPTIATYIDDVYYPSPAGTVYDYNDVARIEVLKGPQGTLFGRNAAGGVINIITKDPSQTPSADLSVGYANYNTFTANLYATAPLTDDLAANLSGYYENQGDGWGRDLATGKPVYLSNETSLRTKWVYTPSQDWTIRFIADYDSTRDDVSSVLAIAPGTVNRWGYGHTGGFYDKASSTPGFGENHQYGVSLRVDHDMGWASLVDIVSWRDSFARGVGDNTDASVLSQYTYDITGREKDATEELQLVSPGDSDIKWIAGLFLYTDQAGENPLYHIGFGQQTHPQSTTILISQQNTTSYAGYAQATAPVFSDDNRLTLGLRYTADSRDVQGKYYNVDGTQYDTAPLQRDSWPKLTYRAAFDHDFTPDILGYISYDRGFKSGYFATGNPKAPAVAPEVLDAYEIGVKSDLFDHTVRFNVSAFYYDFKNLQVQEIITVAGATTVGVFNAAAAKNEGVDIDLTYQPFDRLTFYASGEFLASKYANFAAAPYTFPCVTPTTAPACAPTLNGGGYYQVTGDPTGNQITFAAPFTGSLTAHYSIPSSVGDFDLSGSVNYNSGYYFDVQNTLKQPSFTLIDSSVQWIAPNGKFDITLWGKNLSGVEYFAQYQRSSTVTTYSAEAPRTFGIRLAYHWG